MFIFPILIIFFLERLVNYSKACISTHWRSESVENISIHSGTETVVETCTIKISNLDLCKSMTHQFMQLQKLIFLQKSAVISRDDSPQVVETPCDHQAFPVLPALHKTPTLNTTNQYSSADLGNPPHPLSFCKHFVCTFFFFFLILTVYNTGICYTEDSAIH